eukprot:TRINITY_DN22874_c0_g1_i1.p1 TRINITY_DN22874_c0_g1~~TRINITY_DN22874_c0_g1_i1.p1  ORF type:complete len:322 (-),score=43.17 TRINITY_DN22874_c0_g1_i1:581-1546(-)
MPQRHSRNNNDLSHFTYEERRRLGFGTQRERLGKDSVKPFDACCLCIKPAVDPLCCRKGHVYCKECIYRSLLEQKKDIKRKLILYENQERLDRDEAAEQSIAERERQLAEFERQNNSAVPSGGSDGASLRSSDASGAATSANDSHHFHGANSVRVTAFETEALRTMRAYWLPSATPEAPKRLDAPGSDTLCPQGNEKLRMKDLFALNFHELPQREEDDVHVGGERFMCFSCKVTITNTTKLVAIATCGHVVCHKCSAKFVEVEKVCVECGKGVPRGKKDLVDLEKGGTGYAGHGDQIVATAFKHLGSGSGAAPLRPITKLR